MDDGEATRLPETRGRRSEVRRDDHVSFHPIHHPSSHAVYQGNSVSDNARVHYGNFYSINIESGSTPGHSTDSNRHLSSQLAENRASLLESLRYGGMHVRRAMIDTAFQQTCSWILQHDMYLRWLATDGHHDSHGLLWIKGKPAAGRSTIMKYLVAEHQKNGSEEVFIAFFFNARGGRLEKSTEGMYRSLLLQLLDCHIECQTVLDALEPISQTDRIWLIPQLQKLLVAAIRELRAGSLTCFIDALDECDEDEIRDMIVFIRHYPHVTIRQGLELVLDSQDGHQKDISTYIDGRLRAAPGKMLASIKSQILQRSSGVFLWVVLVIQLLNKEFDKGRGIAALHRKLGEIPVGLHDLFADILSRDHDNREEQVLCLQWIMHSLRPLTCEELFHAVKCITDPDDALETDSMFDSAEEKNEFMRRFLLNSSAGLAEVIDSDNQNRVQFIHESVRDFLLKSNERERIRIGLADRSDGNTLARLAECCQIYISLVSPRIATAIESEGRPHEYLSYNFRRQVLRDFPFLGYSLAHVLEHADTAESRDVSQLDFLAKFDFGLWRTYHDLVDDNEMGKYGNHVSPLYVYAQRNLPHLIRLELSRTGSIDILGGKYRWPLAAAVARSNDAAVTALLTPLRTDSASLPRRDNCESERARTLKSALQQLQGERHTFPEP